MMVRVRVASVEDAAGMSRVLRDIIAQTGRERPHDTAFVLAQYISNPDNILCSVAVDEADQMLGFQSLLRALGGNRYGVPEGWGIIGTHISPGAHRRGLGAALFASSRAAAAAAGVQDIDAYIGASNDGGLRYYDAMGFRTYREIGDIVQKAYHLA